MPRVPLGPLVSSSAPIAGRFLRSRWVWTLLALTSACGGPPAPVEPPPERPPPAEPGPVIVSLGPPTELAGATTRPRSPSDLASQTGLIVHPESAELEEVLDIPLGEERLVVGYRWSGDVVEASADLDRDGVIGDRERVVLAPGGRLSARVERSDGPVDVALRLDTNTVDGVRIYGIAVDSFREGVLPGGVAFRVDSQGGVYDHPKAHLTVDENGDGRPDMENWLVSFNPEEGIVEARGTRWRFSVASDGATVTLEPTEAPAQGLRRGRPAPDFSLPATDGEVHQLARYRGRPVLLDFWATWCAPCVALHPEVEALAARHDLAVLGISADDSLADVKRWLARNPTPWPSVAVGPAGPVNLAYGVSAWPTHALVDGEGRLVVLGTFAAVRRALGETVEAAP